MSTEFSRVRVKRCTIEGLVPTIPLSDDLNDFDENDIFLGELYLNTFNGRLFFRDDNGITEIETSGLGVKGSSSGNTPFNIASVPVPDDSALLLEAEVMAIQSDGSKAANIYLRQLYKNDGGVLTAVGSLVQNVSGDFTTLTATMTLSGTNALIQCTGEAATSVRWTTKYKISYSVA